MYVFVYIFVRANLENGSTDFDDSFFVGTLRTPINTWATLFAEKLKTKGQKEVKNGIFSCFLPVSDDFSKS